MDLPWRNGSSYNSQYKLTNEMILRKMQEIDLRDGKADGKVAAQLIPR